MSVKKKKKRVKRHRGHKQSTGEIIPRKSKSNIKCQNTKHLGLVVNSTD